MCEIDVCGSLLYSPVRALSEHFPRSSRSFALRSATKRSKQNKNSSLHSRLQGLLFFHRPLLPLFSFAASFEFVSPWISTDCSLALGTPAVAARPRAFDQSMPQLHRGEVPDWALESWPSRWPQRRYLDVKSAVEAEVAEDGDSAVLS